MGTEKDLVSAAVSGLTKEALREQSLLAPRNQGSAAGGSSFRRYVVIEVVPDPQAVDDVLVDHFRHNLGVSNWQFSKVLPRNTLVVKPVLQAGASAAEPALFAFPFFPSHLALPCKAGEHVWVMFESSVKMSDAPFWFCRVNDPGFADDVNHTHAPRNWDPSFASSTASQFSGDSAPTYDFQNGVPITADDGTRYAQPETACLADDDPLPYERLLQETSSSKLTNYEPVPRFRKRPPDIALEGSNNTLFVLGSERSGPIGEYVQDDRMGLRPKLPVDDEGSSKGEILLVAGRGQQPSTSGNEVTNSLGRKELGKSTQELVQNEGDPDLANDRASFMLSMSTDIDKRLGLVQFNVESMEMETTSDGKSVFVLKSDRARLVVRRDLEIINVGSLADGDMSKLQDGIDKSKFAVVVLRHDGCIVLQPSDTGYVLMGGADADKAVLCTDIDVKRGGDGRVSASPITSTMGGFVGNTGFAGQGMWASKVLVKLWHRQRRALPNTTPACS